MSSRGRWPTWSRSTRSTRSNRRTVRWSRPTRDREAGDPLEVGEVVGHQRGGEGEGVRGDHEVHRADRLAGSFQLVPDAAIVRRAGRAVVVEHFEGRQDLANGDDLG